MRIIDNELIRKYFDDDPNFNDFGSETNRLSHEALIAYRILIAMQQPIKKGDEYLLIDSEIICEKIADSNSLDHELHLGALRLPMNSQKRQCGCCSKANESTCPCICHQSYSVQKKENNQFVTWDAFKELEKSLMNRCEEEKSYHQRDERITTKEIIQIAVCCLFYGVGIFMLWSGLHK